MKYKAAAAATADPVLPVRGCGGGGGAEGEGRGGDVCSRESLNAVS